MSDNAKNWKRENPLTCFDDFAYQVLDSLLKEVSNQDTWLREDLVKTRHHISGILAGLEPPQPWMKERYRIYWKAQEELRAIMEIIGIMSRYYGVYFENPNRLVSIVLQEE